MVLIRRMLIVGLASLFLVGALPTGSAQTGDLGIKNPSTSTPTTLYMHIDGIQDFPINTQQPDDRYQKGEAYGGATTSTSCTPELPTGSLTSNDFHTYYGYSTPGYVEYDFEENGGPRYHKERGISFDAKLDTSHASTVYWYLETQVSAGENSPGGQDPNTAPVVVPNVKVRATMRSGDDVSVGDEAFNAGAVIARGESETLTLDPHNTGGEGTVGAQPGPGGKHVYEFAVPLSFEGDTITRDESYNVRIDVYIDGIPGCEEPENGYFMPNLVRVHTSPEFRPRIDLAVMNPIRIEYIHPQFVGEELVIHTSMNSPWGNYDVDEQPGGITIGVDGPTPAASLARAAFVQRHHEHFFHQEPVDVTYVWPYKQDGAAKGVYHVNVEVWNDQHTALATGKAAFEIGKNVAFADDGKEVAGVGTNTGDKDSPGVGLVALLGILGAALVALRRRQA